MAKIITVPSAMEEPTQLHNIIGHRWRTAETCHFKARTNGRNNEDVVGRFKGKGEEGEVKGGGKTGKDRYLKNGFSEGRKIG